MASILSQQTEHIASCARQLPLAKRKRHPTFWLLLALGLTLLLCLIMQVLNQGPKAALPLVVKIGICTWPGYAPCLVGKQQKLFAGMAVEIKIIDDLTARDAAFRSGELDVLLTSADLWVQEQDQGLEGKIALICDESYGSDGILAGPNIGRVSDLKGKRIAFARATPSHYLLYKILQEAKLTPADIVQIKVEDPSSAGQAFVGGSVDAAVTWEPFISSARKAGKGKVLVTTRDYPGYVVDVLVVSPRLLQNQPLLQNFLRGWQKSVDYMITHPKECRKPIADGFHMDIQDVEIMMAGLRLADQAMNQKYLCKDALRPARLESTLADAGKFWKDQGIIKALPDTSSMMTSVAIDSANSATFSPSAVTERKKIDLLQVCAALVVFVGCLTVFWLALVKSGAATTLTFSVGVPKQRSTLISAVYWLSPLAMIALWWIGCATDVLPSKFIPAPQAVLTSLFTLTLNGTLLKEGLISFSRIVIGFSAASMVGVAVGLAAGSFLAAKQLITPINSFLRYIPPTAFVALLIVYCGVDELFKYAVVFVGVVFFVVQMVIDVVEDTETGYLEMAMTSGLSNWGIFLQVILPAAGPRVFDVLRINLSATWTFLVVAELIGSEQGLGHFVAISQRFLRLDDLFAGIIVFGIIGLSTDLLLQRVGERLFAWQQTTKH